MWCMGEGVTCAVESQFCMGEEVRNTGSNGGENKGS